MGRDPGDERGGDQSAWLDLVARLELPNPADVGPAPWPERENLGKVAAGDANAAGEQDKAGAARDPDLVMPADGSGLAPGAGRSAGGPGNPDKRSPTNHSHVIRPASFMRLTENADSRPADPSPRPHGADPPSAAGGTPADADQEPAVETEGEPDDLVFADPEPWRPSARNLSPEEYLNLADVGYIDYDIGNQDDERYIPPPLPPQPKLDPVAKGAWTALLGGPGYLFLATLLSWQIPGWAQLAAIIAFVGGFVVLVLRLGDGPSKRDGPDQGAVV